MGSDEGGRRAAILYTLIESCRMNDVEPWEYFKFLMQWVPVWPKTILSLSPYYRKRAEARTVNTS